MTVRHYSLWFPFIYNLLKTLPFKRSTFKRKIYSPYSTSWLAHCFIFPCIFSLFVHYLYILKIANTQKMYCYVQLFFTKYILFHWIDVIIYIFISIIFFTNIHWSLVGVRCSVWHTDTGTNGVQSCSWSSEGTPHRRGPRCYSCNNPGPQGRAHLSAKWEATDFKL